jgi:hypothetical protein
MILGRRSALDRHCERSEAIQRGGTVLDCFVASLLAMTINGNQLNFVTL